MKCRIDISGRKVWNDNNNAHGTRPPTVEIRLLRDGEIYKRVTLNSAGNGRYKFPCLIVWKSPGVKYVYTIDEAPVNGYSKTVQGYNITNKLDTITIRGTKIWDDKVKNDNRPRSITVVLLQNGKQYRSQVLVSPPNDEYIGNFDLGSVPFADDEGNPFVYTLQEQDDVKPYGYRTRVDGFIITNTVNTYGFSFNKTSTATGLSLQGAVFEIRQNGSLISSSASDAAGNVSFSDLLPGTYQMAETQPPVGYMDNTDIYDVVVSIDGIVTIDGLPATLFGVRNTPKPDEVILRRAIDVLPAYMSAPNTWPLHGTIAPDLYMLDKILITLPRPAVTVKWAYGVQDEAYFQGGGGIDITAAYQDGFAAPLNTDYTVYVKFADGTDLVASIKVDRLRDGTEELPYLLIDFTTAGALNPSVPGIDQFTLYYMQGNGVKLTQHYEIYENIDMEGKVWEPIGPLQTFEAFTGSLYGNGNDIKNLSIGDMATEVGDYLGFFRLVGDGAKIQNLNITNSNIGNSYASAGFTAYVAIEKGGSVLLKDLHFKGRIKAMSAGGGIAGIAGVIDGSLVIDSCTINGNIESAIHAAGIAGYCDIFENCSLSIINCYSSGSVISRNSSGIIGILSSRGSTEISNCVNAMTVESSDYAGGIAAQLFGSGSAIFSSCCNKGDITGSTCGGITSGNDINSQLSYKIINCYNSGNINASSAGGGIYGLNYVPSVTQNCYNTGNVHSSNTAGGISMNYGTTENCAAVNQTVSADYNVARISPINPDAGSGLSNNVAYDNMQVLINGVQKDPLDTGSSGADGISVTATQIKIQSLYENTLGWNFNTVWSFGNGAYTLPILRGIPASLQPDILPPHLV